jgi:GNAT superfamily N-acetyltransferase
MTRAAAFAPITVDDIEELAALVNESFSAYRTFAPAGWTPPPHAVHADGLKRWIEDPGFWGELARDRRALIGHAAVIPAPRHSFRPEPDRWLAHLGHLYLRPRYWGSGLAAELLARAAAAAADHEYTAMRLFVPLGQARARRFYEREGFSLAGEPFDPGVGLPVLEYRRLL